MDRHQEFIKSNFHKVHYMRYKKQVQAQNAEIIELTNQLATLHEFIKETEASKIYQDNPDLAAKTEKLLEPKKNE